MASSASPAMTPEQAAAVVSDLRGYRQGLTARAAGIVWMVWGFALALLAATDLAVTEVPADGELEEGLNVEWPGLAGAILPLVVLAGGAVATNAVWKAHALERGAEHRSWIAWAATGGFLAGIFVVGLVLLLVVASVGFGDSDVYLLIWPAVGAMGAAGISILQRARVSPWPGIAAAAVLVALQVALPAMVDGRLQDQIVAGVQWSMLAILVVFCATGLWHHRRG